MSEIKYSYEIDPRPADLGGGWRLRLIEEGEEVSGGAFPAGDAGYGDAIEEGDAWLATRQHPGE